MSYLDEILEFNKQFVINDLGRLNLTKKMYDKVNCCSTWKGVYDIVSTAKKSVRRKLVNNFSVNLMKSRKSQVRFLYFSI